MENNYPFISMLRKYVSSSVLLVIATVAALIIANSPWGDTYRMLWELPVSVSLGDFNVFSHNGHPLSLGAFINDYLMAIFFLSVGLEIKRELLCGELSSMKKALAPIIGACGGMIIPVIVFFLVCPKDPDMERGMAIPMATDIAFSLGCLSIFSKRCPVSLKVFLAALAVADDLGGIIVIAIRYTEHLNLWYLLGAAILVVVLCIGNWRGVRTKAFYFDIGFLLWYCMLGSGIHATIAGVIVAFCIPANVPTGTKFWLERIRHKLEHFPETTVTFADRNKPVVFSDEEIAMLKSVESASDHLISPLQDMEDILKMGVNYQIIPLFAFFQMMNLKRTGEESGAWLEVRYEGKIKSDSRTKGRYRLYVTNRKKSELVEFANSDSFLVHLLYIIEKVIRDDVNTLDFDKYKDLFVKLSWEVYRFCDGEERFKKITKGRDDDGNSKERRLSDCLGDIKKSISKSCKKLGVLSSPYYIENADEHLYVSKNDIVLPDELMDVIYKWRNTI